MPSMFLFMFMYMISFLLVMSSNDWFLVWLGLEMNMMSYIILVYKRYSMNCMESCFKYFFIQSVGSAIFIGMFYLNQFSLDSLMLLLLSYKVGAGPFFFWFPSVCMGLEWISCLILMSVQKLMPLMLMSLFIGWSVWLIVIISLVYGVFGSFNQSNIKKLVAYSSIHHLGWILLCNLSSDMFWLIYLLLYSFILLSVMCLFMVDESVDIFSVSKWKRKLWFFMSMLSMAGMPPLLGFFLKLTAFFYIMKASFFLFMFMVVMSVIMFYVYIRMIYDIIMMFGIYSCYNNVIIDIYNVDMINLIGFVFGLIIMLYMIFL